MPRFDAEYVPKSAMAIFAHPDDLEFMVGGTVARWTKEGCEVTLVLLTSGDAGTHDTRFTRETLMQTREREAHEAAEVLGIRHLVFLRNADCELFPTPAIRKELVREIRRYRPEVVLCGDPQSLFFEDRYVNHPDHRAAGELALAAAFPLCEMELLWPELGPVHKVSAIYVGATLSPNIRIDIADTITAKIEALRRHESQVAPDIGDYILLRAADEAERTRTEGEAGEYVENFRVIKLVKELKPPG